MSLKFRVYLYKICQTDRDNRRPGETRLRAAVVRLFGRKKDVTMTQLPMEMLPTAPLPQLPSNPSVPSTPRVKSIYRPTLPSRQPTRRINIEEYNYSSEDEIMPFKTKQVRMNTVPEVRAISRKRRAPPTPLVSTVYLREDLPYYLDTE